MTDAANPYAAPTARVEDVAADSAAEATRRAHISHEGSIKAVGFLYYLGGVVMTIGGLAAVVGATHADAGAFMMLFVLAVGIGQLVAGWGVRSLEPWGRIIGIVLAVLGLLAFPIGTVINAYILYLFVSKKGRTIFSPGYQEIIAATPQVKYKTSIIVWIFLALILGLLVVGIGVMMIGGK
jgi:Ca2+/Na+ antiporter